MLICWVGLGAICSLHFSFQPKLRLEGACSLLAGIAMVPAPFVLVQSGRNHGAGKEASWNIKRILHLLSIRLLSDTSLDTNILHAAKTLFLTFPH